MTFGSVWDAWHSSTIFKKSVTFHSHFFQWDDWLGQKCVNFRVSQNTRGVDYNSSASFNILRRSRDVCLQAERKKENKSQPVIIFLVDKEQFEKGTP